MPPLIHQTGMSPPLNTHQTGISLCLLLSFYLSLSPPLCNNINSWSHINVKKFKCGRIKLLFVHKLEQSDFVFVYFLSEIEINLCLTMYCTAEWSKQSWYLRLKYFWFVLLGSGAHFLLPKVFLFGCTAECAKWDPLWAPVFRQPAWVAAAVKMLWLGNKTPFASLSNPIVLERSCVNTLTSLSAHSHCSLWSCTITPHLHRFADS